MTYPTTPVDLDRLDALERAARFQGTRAVAASRPSDGGIDWAVVDGGSCVLAECFEVVGPNGYRQPAESRAKFIVEAAARYPALSAELRALRAENERLRAAVTRVVNVADRRGKWIDDLSDEVSELRRFAARNIDAAAGGA